MADVVVKPKKSRAKKVKEEPKTCPVCMDHFTPIIRQAIVCPFCPHTLCRQCCSRYLLTSLNDPHCMGCKREWNREFIDINLTQTFRKGLLRQHRRRVLMDREKGRLPAMQAFVEAQKTIQQCGVRIADLRRRRIMLKRQRDNFVMWHKRPNAPPEFITRTQEELEEKIGPIDTERTRLKEEKREQQNALWAARRVLTGEERPEARQFIMKCPAEECRGFLSTAWKCGTCQKFFCADCHAEKAGQRDEAHTCKEDAKATASLIRQETRPCPKCGIRISKIDGCDQMWCTSCQTTFSWNTGQILLNTVVHNPHYYEYLRRVNNGAIPREAGDVPCGGLPGAYTLQRMVHDTGGLTADERLLILNCHRCLTDIQHVRLAQYPLRLNANIHRDIDIAYLLNNVTEEEWGTNLERTETNGERRREIGLILQTLLHVGSEKFTAVQNSTSRAERLPLFKQLLVEMKQVLDYTNKSLMEKGLQMGIVVPHISDEWYWRMMRRGDMKPKGMKKGGKRGAAQNTIVVPQTQSAQEEMPATSDTPAILPTVELGTHINAGAGAPPSPVDSYDEEERLVDVELPDGERLRMTADQARELFGTR